MRSLRLKIVGFFNTNSGSATVNNIGDRIGIEGFDGEQLGNDRGESVFVGGSVIENVRDLTDVKLQNSGYRLQLHLQIV